MEARVKYEKQLGMDLGTAQHRLRKQVLFRLVKETCGIKCYRCSKDMSEDDFTLDHKVAWRNSPKAEALFWDSDNVAWSHSVCNTQASRSANGLLEFCKNGHKLSGKNVRVTDTGRDCRVCEKERWHSANRSRDRRILRLHAGGHSTRQIAAKVGVSHVTVWKVLKKSKVLLADAE